MDISVQGIQVTCALSILFLLLMIAGHITGPEPQEFKTAREIISVIFFPGLVLTGQLLGVIRPLPGGLVATLAGLFRPVSRQTGTAKDAEAKGVF